MVGSKEIYNPYTHRIETKNTCTCHACRKKHKILTVSDKERLKAGKIDLDCFLEDIPLFCRVFPEGLVGSCGFMWFGFCAVFEDSCVRSNELGDRTDYGVGLKNPFAGGEPHG